MQIRKGYLVVLVLAVGLLLWSEVLSPREPTSEDSAPAAVEKIAPEEAPWQSAEAVYECAMKAEELSLSLTSMDLAADVMEGRLVVSGKREALQKFYSWLESDGRFRAIDGVSMETEDEDESRLHVSYRL
ncbi:MAG: hypothetical protein Q4C56_05610 [Peptococcaceae bacterium]|nr:hypothetical protein [Peptococcaceae bacterium]